MEVRLDIDNNFLKALQEKIGYPADAYDLTREALTIFNWAVEEVAAGHVLLSTNADGDDVRRLAMPILTQVEARAKAQAIESPA